MVSGIIYLKVHLPKAGWSKMQCFCFLFFIFYFVEQEQVKALGRIISFSFPLFSPSHFPLSSCCCCFFFYSWVSWCTFASVTSIIGSDAHFKMSPVSFSTVTWTVSPGAAGLVVVPSTHTRELLDDETGKTIKKKKKMHMPVAKKVTEYEPVWSQSQPGHGLIFRVDNGQ